MPQMKIDMKCMVCKGSGKSLRYGICLACFGSKRLIWPSENAKICSQCKHPRSRKNGFYKNSKSTDGLQGRCKECEKQNAKDYRAKHREELKKYNREYWRNHKKGAKLQQVKRNTELAVESRSN